MVRTGAWCNGESKESEKKASMEKYLSAHDASRILGVTGNAVLLMAKRGELPIAAETESGIRLFRRKDVEQLAERRETKRERASIGQELGSENCNG